MCDLDVSAVKSVGKKYKKKLHVDAGLLTMVAYSLWLVTDFTQAEACAIVGAKLFNLSVLVGSTDDNREAYLTGEISWSELVARYRLRNGGGDKALARMGPKRVAEWLDGITALAK
jgi:hypothetical protein